MFYSTLPNRIINLAIFIIVFVNGCSRGPDHPATQSAAMTKSEQSTAEMNVQVDDITKFDFKNYSYPLICEYRESSPNSTFKLIDVTDSKSPDNDKLLEVGLTEVLFDHVAGNGKSKEAIVIVSPLSHGSGMEYWVYIFGTDDHNKLKLLWSLGFGDRSAGGLRDVYGDKGNLVLEHYNNDFSKGYFPGPACCAKAYTRAVYEWTGYGYQLIEARKMRNSEDSASLKLSHLAKRQKG
ncbi:MAG: hypothetical protein IPO77_13625 [Acidobacteria bacterium]|nr:hypothetical protein [Acidobacteriota bacterium]